MHPKFAQSLTSKVDTTYDTIRKEKENPFSE